MRWYASLIILLVIFWLSACGAEQGLQRSAAPAEPAVQEPDSSAEASAASQTSSKEPELNLLEDGTSEGVQGGGEAVVSEGEAADESEQTVNAPLAEEAPQQVYTNHVTLSISGESDMELILESTAIELEEGDTVLDVLKRETRKQKIPMEYHGGRGPLAYVEGINNLYEFDHGPESGWVYYVNGERPSKGAGSYSLEAGDVVEWVYVTKDTDKEEAKEES